jgi:hypothetical protein
MSTAPSPSLPKSFPGAILETIIAGLATLFLTGADGDLTAARQAATQMLSAYDPQTEDELHLAASIVSFSFQALEALSQAAAPEVPLTRSLRLRGGAVSLSRESHKAQRRLDKLQAGRRRGIGAHTQAEPTPEPKTKTTLDLVETARTVAGTAKANGLTWTQAYEQRQRDARLAARLKRAEARVAPPANPASLGAPFNHQAAALSQSDPQPFQTAPESA